MEEGIRLKEYKKEIRASVEKHSRNKVDESIWSRLNDMITYYRFDFREYDGYLMLKKYLEIDEKANTKGNRIYYLAVAPEYLRLLFMYVYCRYGQKEGSWSRLVIIVVRQKP